MSFDARHGDPGMVIGFEVARRPVPEKPVTRAGLLRRAQLKMLGAATTSALTVWPAESYQNNRREVPNTLSVIDHVVGNTTLLLSMAAAGAVVWCFSEYMTIKTGPDSSTAAWHPQLFEQGPPLAPQ